eukprot:2148086-Heterocapsa_arctica.AAC.1
MAPRPYRIFLQCPAAVSSGFSEDAIPPQSTCEQLLLTHFLVTEFELGLWQGGGEGGRARRFPSRRN